jgi:dTDP-4-amino-4,6-dideoxygalactose transaminase
MSRQPKEFRVVCYDQERVNQCIRILTNYTGVDEKNQIEVTIKPYKKNRSKEQNNTLWMWYNIFVASDPACRSTGELHEHMKRKYLIPLLEAKDEAYRGKLEQLRGFYRQGQVEAAEAAFEAILWLSSTTTLNVTEMTSFMESVHSEAESLGIVLPLPDKEKRT